MSQDLQTIVAALVAGGRGILAADETVPTLTRRFEALGIPSTEESRRTYREMLFTAPGAAAFIGGVIMQDETIRQKSSGGAPLAQVLSSQGIVPGINRLPESRPWMVSFSYGRALQDPALEAWHGRDENLKAGQQALTHRARCNAAAALGTYTDAMEASPVGGDSPAHRS